jgi:adenylate cyclase
MNKKIPIFIGMLILAVFVWLSLTPNPAVKYVITRIDNIFYDIQLRIHIWNSAHRLRNSIAIVDIDDESLKQIGRWPWPRSTLSKLIDNLKSQGAVVIATDMMFSEPDVNVVTNVIEHLNAKKIGTPDITTALNQIMPEFEQDGIFAHSLQDMEGVLGMVLVPSKTQSGMLPSPLLQLNATQNKDLSILNSQGFISNIPILQEAAKGTGFLNVFPDLDGIIRRAPIVMRYQNSIYPSLAFEAARRYLLAKNVELITPSYGDSIRLEGIKMDNYIIPTDEKGQALVPFVGQSYTFPYISAAAVMNNKAPEHAFEGKLVFIGTSATGEGDIKATAIDKVFPGVEIQASIANGILTHYFPYKPAWATGAELVLTVVIGFLAAIIFPYLGPLMVSVLTVSIPLVFVGLLLIEEWLWNRTGFIFSILIPFAMIIVLSIFNIVYGYLFEARKRKRLKGMFGQYVPKKHIEEMLKAKGNYGMLGDDRAMTVLFADIRSFTSISEGMKASELKEMLNAFFTPMTEIIFKHKGTIDKYVGDLIMAFWGAPLKDKNHAQHALAAALDMQETITKMAPELAARGWPTIQMGIGLNSGIMSVGDMGSKFRRNYTVLGDEVNLASRVESLTKFYGVNIMTTEHTQALQKQYALRLLDKVRVKGKQQGIHIYEVVDRIKNASADLLQELEEHQQAINLYFSQQFDEAKELFDKLYEKFPQTKIYMIYLERLAAFKVMPPPADWDGIYIHTTK